MRKFLVVPLLGLLTSFTTAKPIVKSYADETHPLGTNLMPTKIDTSQAEDNELQQFYSIIEGKKGNILLEELNTLISGHREYNYESSEHRKVYKIIDRNWQLSPLSSEELNDFNYTNDNGYIRKLYADYNDDINKADQFQNEGATRVSFDKEHIWAQSLGDFGRTGGAGSDLHALWPSDVIGNQQAHSNYNFGIPTENIKEVKNDKGTYVGRNGYIAGSTQKVFEPLDEFKGDIARAMFYMPARYFNHEGKLYPKLTLVDYSPSAVTATSNENPGLAGVLSTLLEWNELDPVDEHEIMRNNLIANNYQGNRNPFIDYPQLARIVYDPNYTGSGASLDDETSSVGKLSDPFVNLELDSISLNTTNAKTEYFLKDSFDSKGLIVTGKYDDGSSRIIRNYSLSLAQDAILNTAGNFEITVTVNHNSRTKTQSYPIEVQPKELKEYLFITQAFGDGDNEESLYYQDFIELYNASTNTINLMGKSFQYSSPTGNAWSKTYAINLIGEIPPKSHHLIGLKINKSPSDIQKALPLQENYKSIDMGAINMKMALVNGIGGLSGYNPSSDSRVIDFIGAGNANGFLTEKINTGANTLAYHRKMVEGIYVNTWNNKNDYTVGPPTPRNSALSIAYDIMEHSSVNSGICSTLYPDYKERILNLTPDYIDEEAEKEEDRITTKQLTYFQTDILETKMVDGRARYEAWAIAVGDDKPYEYVPLESSAKKDYINSNDNHIIYIVILAFVSAGLYAIMKIINRKESVK